MKYTKVNRQKDRQTSRDSPVPVFAIDKWEHGTHLISTIKNQLANNYSHCLLWSFNLDFSMIIIVFI